VRLVLDTDVVVAAMRSPRGASAELLRAVRRKRATMLISTAMFLEYADVCLRPEHRRAAGLVTRQVEYFLDAIAVMAEPVEVHYRWRPQLRDAGDEMVLEAAVNGQAAGLVTFNRRHYADAPARFGIEVMLPGEALGRIAV
jgi:putative PIN family toxin of toxin-antitoxin system